MLKSWMPAAFGFREARWLILLGFPVACIPALVMTDSSEPAYYLGAAMLACAWLLRRLHTARPETMAVWLVLLVFIVFYFLRYPVLLLDPAAVAATHPDSIAPLFLSDRAGLTRALQLSSAAFVFFCVVAGLLLRLHGARTHAAPAVMAAGNARIMKGLLVVVPLLMVALAVVAYKYRIGQMGVAPGEPLPFRLKGLVFHARHVLVPLLILTLIWRATLVDDRRLLHAGLLLLSVHGISDTILRGSRSSLLLCLLLALFLCVSGGLRIRRRGVILLGAMLLAAVLLIPTIMQYRALRFESDAAFWQLFVQAFGAANQDLPTVIRRSFNSVYFRIPGIETAWAVGSLVSEPLGLRLLETIRSPFGVTGYLNFEVYRVPLEAYTLYAPGFVGWLYLAAGWPGVMAGSVALAVFCVGLPRILYGGRLRCPPVANAFLLWILFISLTDGTLDGNFLLIAAGLATLAALEVLDRAGARNRTV